MLSASALAFAGCNDSTSVSDVEDNLQYHMVCSSPASCELTMETNQQGNVSVVLSSINLKDYSAGYVADANVQAQLTGTTVSIMDGSSTTANIKSNSAGIATLAISSGAVEGDSKISFTATDFETEPALREFTIHVVKPQVVPPTPTEKNVNYSAIIAYYGPQEGFTYVEAFAVPNGNCSKLLTSEMTAKDVAALKPTQIIGSQNVSGDISGQKVSFEAVETTPVNYAVISRAKIGDEYAAYGCVNGLNAENFMVTVVLDDVFIETPVDPCELDPSLPECQTTPVDPCEADPTLPECQEPVDLEYSYSGNFTLTSQFNALSLLPSASENGETPLFKDMLAGDWIQFVLNFLSHPEDELANVLTQQVLKPLSQAEWLTGLISKIPDIGPVIAVMLETMDLDQLLEQFGIKQVISDYLKQLTGQISWWDEATGGVQIANELATNFTLYGKFTMSSADLGEDGKLAGNKHSYSSVLYHNGTFDKCLVGKDFGTDINGSKICEIPISTLDKDASSVTGTFTAKFGEIAADKGTVDVLSHNLNLAYGKLIYAALLQIMPYVMNTGDGVKIDSIGDILAYYIGLGAVALYNKSNSDNPIEGVAGCDAVGKVLVQAITDKLAGQDASAFATFLSFILQPGTVAGLCSMGIGALDNMLDKQLDKLSVSSDKITFSTPADKACTVAFAGEPPYKKLAYFGMSDYKWGMDPKVDERCTWNVEIKAREGVEPRKINGRFYAYGKK